ncbi:MAG: sulfatase-like hydrolase/transferase [Kiritimatiellia bacterium]
MQKPTRPNILLITTDQQRFDTIHAAGNPHIMTPNLNWLVDNGISFDNAYTDCPICMPARATIMTGRHGFTMGLTGNHAEIRPIKPGTSLAGLLTAAGYQTRAQGKMHFSPCAATMASNIWNCSRTITATWRDTRKKGSPWITAWRKTPWSLASVRSKKATV